MAEVKLAKYEVKELLKDKKGNDLTDVDIKALVVELAKMHGLIK